MEISDLATHDYAGVRHKTSGTLVQQEPWWSSSNKAHLVFSTTVTTITSLTQE